MLEGSVRVMLLEFQVSVGVMRAEVGSGVVVSLVPLWELYDPD